MSNDANVETALKKAAEALLERKLNAKEVEELEKRFRLTKGAIRERADEALGKATGLTPNQIRTKTASSDNADRVIRDLSNIINDWKPKG